MLECLEFRDEKNSLGNFPLSYGKFALSRLEKGQGLTVANTLRRVLLYELPAVGITSVLIRRGSPTSSLEENDQSAFLSSNGVQQTSEQIANKSMLIQEESSLEGDSKNLKKEKFNTTEIDLKKQGGDEALFSLETENSFSSEQASVNHEFSTLPGVKESVLEILFNLKSVVFENIFVYSSAQKGTLKLQVEKEVEKKNHNSIPSSQDYKIRAKHLILPSEIHVIHPDQVLATLISPETPFELEFTIEKMKQSDLTSTSSFSGRAPNRSTRNRRILPIDGTVFPVKKVNYTIEQDSFGKEIVFFEVWTNGGLHPRDALFQSIEKVIKLFQTFQE